jgi:WD40 repeat protein
VKQLVSRVAFSPDGRTLAAGTPQGGVRLWDLATWEVRQPVGQRPFGVHSVAFSPDGKTLLTGSCDPVLPANIHFFKDRWYHQRVCRGSTDHAVRLWDTASGRQRTTLPTGHDLTLFALTLSADGRTVAAGGAGGTVWFWDRQTGVCRPPLFVSPQARAAWGSGKRPPKDAPLTLTPVFRENVLAVAFSPDGKLLATVSEDNAGDRTSRHVSLNNRDLAVVKWQIKVWDTASGTERVRLAGPHDEATAVLFAPDGRTLVTNHGRQVRLWDVADGRLRRTLTGHEATVQCLAFSPDGATLATGGHDRVIKLWEADSGREKATLSGHTETVAALAFAPDGRTLASGGWDGTVRLWNLATGQELVSLAGPTGKVNAVAFAADGQTLASGGETAGGSGEVFLWRAPGGATPAGASLP